MNPRSTISLRVLNRAFIATLGYGTAITLAYLVMLSRMSPGFIHNPYALLTHLLLVLAFGTLFFSIHDLVSLGALRWILYKDSLELYREYATRETLEEKLRSKTFWGSKTAARDLGGGLVYSALWRSLAFGRTSTGFLYGAVAHQYQNTKIGTQFIDFAIARAPFLGLLGTLLGWMATIRRLGSEEHATNSGIAGLLPFLGVALVTTMLGLIVTIAGSTFKKLFLEFLESDCRNLLRPTLEGAAQVLSGMGESDLKEATGRMPPEAVRGWSFHWSRELIALKTLGVVVAAFLTLALMYYVSLPGGAVDRLLQFKSETDEIAFSERSAGEQTPVAVQLETAAEKEPDFQYSLEDLLKLYKEAVVPGRNNVFAFTQYGADEQYLDGLLGTSNRVLEYPPDQVPTSGIVDLVGRPEDRRLLDSAYSRLVARVDLLLAEGTDDWVSSQVTFLVSDGGADPPIRQTEIEPFFADALPANGYSYQGVRLEPRYLEALLSPHQVRSIRDQAEKRWRLGRSPGYEHVVLWLAYEKQAKLSYVIEVFEQRKLTIRGQPGDFIAFRWGVTEGEPDGGRIEIRAVEALSPRRVESLLTAELRARRGRLPSRPGAAEAQNVEAQRT